VRPLIEVVAGGWPIANALDDRSSARRIPSRGDTNMAVKPVPEGYGTATPYLIVKDANALLRFVQEAFNARVKEEHRLPDGTLMHADVLIGDSHVMMGQAGGPWEPIPGSVLLYVEDADAVYQAALKAGAQSVQQLTNQFYGDRSGGVRDPSGVTWWISTHIEDVPVEELQRRMSARSR
jgi:PhnB protein